MRIKEEIIIDFPLGKYTGKCIEKLETIYKKAQLIEDKTSEKYQELEGEFYGLTTELEVCVLGAWRSGVFTERQGDLILWKYEAF